MKTKNAFVKLKKEERERRRNIILDAAERVFASTPFTEVNMRRIAREAGISAASIYTYFPDQEALFVETYLRRVKDVHEMFESTIGAAMPDEVVEKLAMNYLDYFIEQDTYFRMMAHFMLYAELHPESLEKLNKTERAMMDIFEKAFKKAGVGGNTRLLTHAFFAGLNGILISFRRYPGRREEEVRRHMHRLGVLLCRQLRGGQP
ncbi:MAG: TetR/AcrR family transcriptional regulator [Chloroflexi bacterium]|nr:TetR/AcrR family transcriptional regulator [Chloroflexota bacterium]MBM3154855.1 TetR/AcrR family transcriptional regulator [Chloroflexota bacterium]MBM3173291.1 TetR/AcrR family transcriptional regulator [Chloroflexota bacterium]MBM3174791.1 TetR/AcrR family transcriptional regulator [Chloroflexota bacterium]MBM4450229.1 TetR/AcrR family transcriptional regulator [Chloroflexota bacterium]